MIPLLWECKNRMLDGEGEGEREGEGEGEGRRGRGKREGVRGKRTLQVCIICTGHK